MTEDSKKELDKLFSALQKDLKLDIRTFSDRPKALPHIPSGSLCLDYVLGIGGYPRGRIIEIYGQPSSGKSLLCLKAIAEVQAMDGRAALIDAEHAFDPKFATIHGVDITKLTYVQPDTGEQALEGLRKMVESGTHDLIVVDSVPALTPKAELESDIGKVSVALQARMMSNALRVLTPIIGKSKTLVIFVNQTRVKPMAFGNPETTPGGEALKFYSSVRLRVNVISGSQVKDVQGRVIGHCLGVKAVKNKVGMPMRQASIYLALLEGFNPIQDLIYLAGECLKMFEVKGAWIHDGEKKFQGWDKFRQALSEDDVYFKDVERRVKELM